MISPKLDDDALDRLFRTARTANGYLPEQSVTETDCRQIYDLVKMAPTAANAQPARFIWCLSQEARDRLAACATGSNPEKIRTAPAAVIIGMDLTFHHHLPQLFPHADARSWFEGNVPLIEEAAFRNSSLQGGYFILAARALGFDVGPMSGFEPERIKAEFFGEEPVRVNFIATFGIADPATIFPRSPRPDFDQFNRLA